MQDPGEDNSEPSIASLELITQDSVFISYRTSVKLWQRSCRPDRYAKTFAKVKPFIIRVLSCVSPKLLSKSMAHSKFSAILHEKCPRCREGDIFYHPLSKISRFSDTREDCPVCGLRYEREPGTFYGAMYVSYGFSVALIVTLFTATFVIGDDPDLMWYFVVIIPAIILAVPVFFRYSRVLWLYFFSAFRYDPKAARKSEARGQN